MQQPPPFKNASSCHACKCSFTAFKRKHHCRRCGNTFCGPCSPGRVPLPRLGFAEPVRVCQPCGSHQPAPAAAAAAPEQKAGPPVMAAPTTTTFLGFGGSQAGNKWDTSRNLDEQCRDAIKAGDVAGVRTLLDAGANASYCDRTGNSLMHLAAMFNRRDMVELLAARGASVSAENPSGETPLDLAPPALAHRMKGLQQ